MTRSRTHRLAVLTSVQHGIPAVLLQALWDAVRTTAGFELPVVGLPAAPPRASFRRRLGGRLYRWVQPPRKRYCGSPAFRLQRWAQQRNIGLVYPPAGDFNSPAFLEHLMESYAPTILFSIYCLQKLRPTLLQAFEQTVNYHNGALPAYRGVRTTGWSIYNGDRVSGFTYHRMETELDTGRILLDGNVPIGADSTAAEIETAKAAAAAAALPELLSRLAGDAEGAAQNGTANYYSQADFARITAVPEPTALTSDELQLRTRAFDYVDLQLAGTRCRVSVFRRVDPPHRGNRLAFRAADGVRLEPACINSLPYSLFRLRSLILGPRR